MSRRSGIARSLAVRKRAGARDGNEVAIVNAFAEMGWRADPVASLTRGFPDLVVQQPCSKCGALLPVLFLVEVKMPGRNLNRAQQRFQKTRYPFEVVTSPDEARAWCRKQIMRRCDACPGHDTAAAPL